MKLDEVFESKGQIANDVKTQLSQAMENYGYEFLQTLVTDLNPDKVWSCFLLILLCYT